MTTTEPNEQAPNTDTPTAAAAVAPAVAPAAVAPAKPAEPVKPDAVEQQPEAEQTAGIEPFTLSANVPMAELTPEREALLSEFSQIAPTAGLDAGTAQGLLDVVVDAATVLTYQAPDEFTNADDAMTEMTHVFGEEKAKDLVTRAQRYVASLGPKVADYLDRTGAGNDVGTLVSLALAEGGLLKLSPAEAQARIEALMKTKEWASGDKLTTITLGALSRIANRPVANRNPLAPSRTPAEAQAGQASRESAKAEARAAAAKMLDPKGPLMNSNHPEHAAAFAAWQKLIVKL